ncbi:tyrosine-type recombinase/integrase [Vibrio splendidus]
MDAIKRIEKHFPNIYIKDVTAMMIDDFLNKTLCNCGTEGKLHGYSTKSREHTSQMLNKLFQYYVNKGELSSNPYKAGTITLKNNNDKKFIRPYTTEELLKLHSVRTEDGVVQSFIVGCEEGLRPSEILGCITSGFNPKMRRLQIQRAIVKNEIKEPKTDYSKRHIEISSLSVSLLSELLVQGKVVKHEYKLGSQNSTDTFFFTNPATGEVWKNSSDYYKALKPYFKRAGVEYRGSQPARHTFVNRSVETGCDKRDVADHIGQSNAKVLVKNYLHWSSNLRGSSQFRQQRERASLGGLIAA